MVKQLHENQNLSYIGTIIDIETIGEYCRAYKGDSREYESKEMAIKCSGIINSYGDPFHND